MMKKLLLAVTLLIAFCLTVLGQDTLDVPAIDNEGNPIVNALIKYVVADTAENGSQNHDVYRLERGKTYFYNQSATFNNPITLIADKPGETFETRPPKIMVTSDDTGEFPGEYCITAFSDIIVKNIAFSTSSMSNFYTWGNAILLATEGLRAELEGCHFNLTGWAIIEAVQNNTVFIMRNSHIRNCLVTYGFEADGWCPFFLEINTGSADSVVMTNNTFYNLTGSIVNIEDQGIIRNLCFDHNTLVNVGRGLSPVKAHLNSVITNNIFFNSPHFCQIQDELAEDDDLMMVSLINADTLISNEPDAPDSIAALSPMEEKDRKCFVRNNVYHWSQGLKDSWTERSDSIVALRWMNDVTESVFNDNEGYPHFRANSNEEITEIGFGNFGGVEDVIAAVKEYDHGQNELPWYGWDPDSADFGEYHFGILGWPLYEDFSHDIEMKGTDGKHIGSLMWYPDEMEGYVPPTTPVNESSNRIVKKDVSLKQNYPNPFNPSTTIEFQLTRPSNVKLSVYNLLGREVNVLVDEVKAAGNHKAVWNGKDESGRAVANGVYFYKLKSADNTEVKKMLFLK